MAKVLAELAHQLLRFLNHDLHFLLDHPHELGTMASITPLAAVPRTPLNSIGRTLQSSDFLPQKIDLLLDNFQLIGTLEIAATRFGDHHGSVRFLGGLLLRLFIEDHNVEWLFH